jgi:hypothetical protein
MSSSNNAVTSSEAGKAILVIAACYDAFIAKAALAEQQVMRGRSFDLIITADCGLEFGPT